MLTTFRLYNLDEDLNIKRIIELSKIRAVTKKSGAVLTEMFDFLIHVEAEHDYLFYSKKREEIVKRIKKCYFVLMNNNLPIFEI